MVVDLKKRKVEGAEDEEEDGAQCLTQHQNARAEIEATLARLRLVEDDQRRQDDEARAAQRDLTRSLIKLMHFDTLDQTKIAVHTAHVSLQNEINAVLKQMRMLEDRYQQTKKSLATIPDKNEKHHRVQQAKSRRDHEIAPLRERLHELDPTARPSSSFEKDGDDLSGRLPTLHGSTPPQKVSSTTYKKVTDQIRELQRSRKTLNDPYAANLKMAKLWSRINEHERALENYESALKTLSEKDKQKIAAEDLPRVLEKERRRKREALEFLFLRAMALNERNVAAKQMKMFLDLATSQERLGSAAYLEAILRKQEYIEDPSLSTVDAVTETILITKSLGPLTDLRFELLQELLAASPNDPYLLETVANLHVRKRDFDFAKPVSDRFVKLPDVKRLQLFASFGEYRPTSSPPFVSANK